MPTLEILQQLQTDLANDFKELRVRETIYVVPQVLWEVVTQPLEIQISEGGGTYKDFEGGIRNGDFIFTIALFYRSQTDWSGKAHDALLRDTANIYTLKERVTVSLEGTFLTGNLLTRPLRIHREASVVSNKVLKGFFMKELTFVGGYNVERPR